MTTYNTYQEAKIANPDKEIIRFDKQDEFKAVGNDELSAYLTTWTRCNPADYCVTIEKFLADGHKFVKGDAFLETDGDVYDVRADVADMMNESDRLDCHRYILRAAALEEKPKPTKFVKVEESIFDLKGEFERGELYMWLSDGYLVVPNETQLSILLDHKQCYRQVEIDWRDEAKKLDSHAIFHDDGDLYFVVDSNSNDFISMCHEIASLTEKPTN